MSAKRRRRGGSLIVTALVIGAAAAGAGAAAPPSVTLAGRPPVLEQGRPWSATVLVRRDGRALRRAAVALVIRQTSSQRSFRAREAAPGRYRARVVFPDAGRWTLAARVQGRVHRLGAVSVRQATEPPIALRSIYGLAALADGTFLVADGLGHRVVRADLATGRLTPFAGNGRFGSSGDGGPATAAELVNPTGVAVDAAGNAYIADVDDNFVRRVDPSGRVTRFAGTGRAQTSGDGGPATSAGVRGPIHVVVDAAGDVLVTGRESRVRKIDAATGIISTVAGTGEEGFSGDGGPAAQARLNAPHGIALAPDGSLLIADSYRIRRVDARTGLITTVAGNGTEGALGDGGPATAASTVPLRVAASADGTLYIADIVFNRIRRVDASGTITTVAGNGSRATPEDSGPATAIGVRPFDLLLAGSALLVADTENLRIWRIDLGTGMATTVLRARR